MFICDPENKGCGENIRLDCSMSNLDDQTSKLKCPKCKKKKPIRRVYDGASFAAIYDPKTIGSLADKNSSKMSNEEKDKIKSKYEDFKKSKNWESTKEGIKYVG